MEELSNEDRELLLDALSMHELAQRLRVNRLDAELQPPLRERVDRLRELRERLEARWGK